MEQIEHTTVIYILTVHSVKPNQPEMRNETINVFPIFHAKTIVSSIASLPGVGVGEMWKLVKRWAV